MQRSIHWKLNNWFFLSLMYHNSRLLLLVILVFRMEIWFFQNTVLPCGVSWNVESKNYSYILWLLMYFHPLEVCFVWVIFVAHHIKYASSWKCKARASWSSVCVCKHMPAKHMTIVFGCMCLSDRILCVSVFSLCLCFPPLNHFTHSFLFILNFSHTLGYFHYYLTKP